MKKPPVILEIDESSEPLGDQYVGFSFSLKINKSDQEFEDNSVFVCFDRHTMIRCVEDIKISETPISIKFVGIGFPGEYIKRELISPGLFITKLYYAYELS